MKPPFDRDAVRGMARAAGFDAVGFTAPHLSGSAAKHYRRFIDAGYHGGMDWLAANRERRENPANIWQAAKSVIVLGHNYGPDADPMHRLQQKDRGTISVYALNEDYHDIIKKKLKALARTMSAQFGGDFRIYVDTAPVLEKPLAQQAGMGWQGKHTCLVSREFGSWLFLGEIFTDLTIPPDEPERGHCGTCRSCLDICPTGAFIDAGKLDARKCISYLTIEHKGHIPHEFRKAMGNRIYGCDDCLAVCPWNKFASESREAAYHPREELRAPLLSELAALDDSGFRALFRKSPIKRIGRDRFIRNVCIALGNSGDSTPVSALLPLLSDPSPLVRAAAAWALGQLLCAAEYASLREKYLRGEADADVIAEWRSADTQ